MKTRTSDFDLRPRRCSSAPTPMLSTWQVDDDDDGLDALTRSAMAAIARTGTSRDARQVALFALPSTLCAPAPDAVWPRRRPAPTRRRRDDDLMLGTVVSAGLAVLLLVAAMLWNLERPRVIHLEDAPVEVLAPTEIDAISSASP